MELLLTRNWRKPDYTIGRLYVNGEFFSNTIEDTDRGLDDSMPLEYIKKHKVYGKTAIPTGTYKVTLTMSPKMKRILPLVNNVKGFSGIRIHSGNTAEDSLGCILPGKNTAVGRVTESKKAEQALMKILLDCHEDITITIKH